MNTKSWQFNFNFLECGICNDNDDNEFLDNGNCSDWHGVSLFIIKNSSKKPTSFIFRVDNEASDNMLLCSMTTYLTRLHGVTFRKISILKYGRPISATDK